MILTSVLLSVVNDTDPARAVEMSLFFNIFRLNRPIFVPPPQGIGLPIFWGDYESYDIDKK
jgi:hypothetical protein